MCKISSSLWKSQKRRSDKNCNRFNFNIYRLNIVFKSHTLIQANRRVEEFKLELKNLKQLLKEAEKRAIQAERTVKALLREVDKKEGKINI